MPGANGKEHQSSLPLAGIRVLDIGHVVAAPFCAIMLADAGAEVIKVEVPKTGETSRSVGPFMAGSEGRSSGTFVRMNRNKKSVTLNLKTPKGREIFKQLVFCSDVVVENFSPGTMEKLKLGYEDVLKPLNPRLIYANISGFGPRGKGPYWNIPAFNLIAQAMGCIMDMTGSKNGPPAYCGVPIGDLIPAMMAAYGILLALRHRELTGKGQFIEITMYDTLVWLSERLFNLFQYNKRLPVRGQDTVVCPHGAYRAKDGYFVVDVYTQVQWQIFCKFVGHEELIDHPDYENGPKRSLKADFLRKIIEDWASEKTKLEASRIFYEHGIPAAPVQNIADIFECPHLYERGMLVRVTDPIIGEYVYPGNPLRFSTIQNNEYSPAPLLGQHTDEVLGNLLGLKGDQMAELRNEGII